MGDGYSQTISEEPSFTRADGVGKIGTHFGVNRFTLSFPLELSDLGAVQRTANILWDFFRDRLNNNNEAFYYYNPSEASIDLTGVSTVGRYLVQLEDPNEVLSREYFKAFCFRFSSIKLIEAREEVPLSSPSISPSSSTSASVSASPSISFLPEIWGRWKFEEASGNRLDSSGNAHHLTLTESIPAYPAAHTATGLLGDCLHSYEDNPGADYSSWLEYTGGTESYPADTSFSFSFWWKGNNRGDEGDGGLEIYFPADEAVINFFNLVTAPAKAIDIYLDVFWGVYEAEMTLSAEAFDYTVWNMFTVTFDGTYVKFYINLTLKWTSGAIDISGEAPLAWGDIRFTDGWYTGEGYLDDSIMLMGTALSIAEIAQLYNSGAGWNAY
jgi:hypothetical protein